MSKFAALEPEGFDVPAALRQLAGSEKLYLSILTKFRTMYRTLPDAMQADMESGNLEKLRRDAHTVKGLAGTMGHSGLGEAAARLERSAEPASLAECARDLAAFRDVFSRVIGALQNVAAS
jgi:HPt (histidine-containing phosphotransfer) domain-containing protein